MKFQQILEKLKNLLLKKKKKNNKRYCCVLSRIQINWKNKKTVIKTLFLPYQIFFRKIRFSSVEFIEGNLNRKRNIKSENFTTICKEEVYPYSIHSNLIKMPKNSRCKLDYGVFNERKKKIFHNFEKRIKFKIISKILFSYLPLIILIDAIYDQLLTKFKSDFKKVKLFILLFYFLAL